MVSKKSQEFQRQGCSENRSKWGCVDVSDCASTEFVGDDNVAAAKLVAFVLTTEI